jgi:lysylphosphatidylglycerol synthetase-like protein (DUF2156 family)
MSESSSPVVRERRIRPDRYGVLLVLILASLLAVALSGEGPVGKILALAGICATLLFALHTSEPSRRLRRAAWVVVTVAVSVAVVFALLDDPRHARMAISAMSALLVVASLLAILRRVGAHARIDLATVGGALCAYLLLGLFFAFVYLFMGASDPDFFVQSDRADTVDSLYFSFVTLSTTGYGDLTARTDLGRMLAVTEAVVGQLYLVSAVALVIGNLGRVRPGRAGDDEIAP